jgi:rhamnose utilization protein RhaD (predicted bifunctional aldolase and dehydrogenase)/NAD(P)-dependent dehydrogenase (short-subunit alcohol dehydrogenase family)
MPDRFQKTAVRALAAHLPEHPEALAALIHASRLIGSDPGLVLHGGGNTSAKVTVTDVFGEAEDILYVKGSGIHMTDIGPEGFSVLRLDPLRRLREIPDLPDDALQNHLSCQRVVAGGPAPSVETLLHAFLPHRFVFHCHADALLILTQQKDARTLIPTVLGEKSRVLPYLHPGYPLARAAAKACEEIPGIDALVVRHHGIFTFAEEAGLAYNRMRTYVKKAEAYIQKTLEKASYGRSGSRKRDRAKHARHASRLAQTLRGVCAGRTPDGAVWRRLVALRQTPEIIDASLCPEAKTICTSGVLTPDHAIRTRNRMVYLESIPESDEALKTLLQQRIAAFRKVYTRHLYGKPPDDPAGVFPEHTDPVLFLVAGIGLFAVGPTAQAAGRAADIGGRTVIAKRKSLALGRYRPLSAAHVRDMERWPLQTKKRDSPHLSPLAGQVALITGGGGAIGYGIARRLLAAGATVALGDTDAARLEHGKTLLSREFGAERVAAVVFDVTDFKAVNRAFQSISVLFGGVDLVVPNAGIAHVSKIEDLDPDTLDRVTAVNFKGAFTAIRAAVSVFRRQGTGGSIVVISSKNVFDPGAAFSAYSASKAAAHQMAKIAAMELAELGVRVNMINPDAVFGDERVPSGLWERVGPERMRARGLTPEGLRAYYRQRSLLKVTVLAEHVGNAVVFFASEQTPTTGASLPVDAGIPAAFPR